MKNNSLKIAMFGHKRIPSREGGVEIAVCELAVRLAEKGNNVTCFNRSGHHVSGAQFDSADMDEYKSVRLKKVWTIERRGFAAVTSSLIAALKVAFGKYDIVHIHAEGSAMMCWIPKLAGKKVIVTIHGLDWQRDKWSKLASKYIRCGEGVAAKWADEIIVLSRNMQDYFIRTYNRVTEYIPNGVNKPCLRGTEEISKVWGLEKDSYVLFVGRLVPEKGLKYLIEAWKGIKTDKKLVIVGGSSDTLEYSKNLRKISPSNVIFTGFLQGDLLEALYSNAYLFVLPSDLEGMSLSLLEGMSYGNCCLVSDISECLEVVEDKAPVFRHSDSQDLRDKIQELLNNPDKVAKYKSEAADYILSKYSWDYVAERTLEVYRSGK